MTITNETELRQFFRSIPAGSLTTIVGGVGSGKTASCAVAIDEFKSQGLSVAYCEAEGFDINRFLPEGVKPDFVYTTPDLQGLETIREHVLGKFDVVVIEGLETLSDPHLFDREDGKTCIGSRALFVQNAEYTAKSTGTRVLLSLQTRHPMTGKRGPAATERFQVLATSSPYMYVQDLYVQEAQVVRARAQVLGYALDVTRVLLGGQSADQSLQG
jgi:molybdopterin-guanine dinucleotide biosynthesis protein